MPKKVYALCVKSGERRDGVPAAAVVSTWSLCSRLVTGAKGMAFKGFHAVEDAVAWLPTAVSAPIDVVHVDPGLFPSNAVPERLNNHVVPLAALPDADSDAYAETFGAPCGLPAAPVARTSRGEARKRPRHDAVSGGMGGAGEAAGGAGAPTTGTPRVLAGSHVVGFTDGSCFHNGTVFASGGFGVAWRLCPGDLRDPALAGPDCASPLLPPDTAQAMPLEPGIVPTSPRAEMYGLAHALHALCVHAHAWASAARVSVFCDCEVAVRAASGERVAAVEDANPNADMLRRLAALGDRARQLLRQGGIELHVLYVPGHEGVDGNETVDALAADGCAMYHRAFVSPNVWKSP